MATATKQTTINIPTPLRGYTENKASIAVEASTVGEALSELVVRYPDIKTHLYDSEGKLRSFVNVYRNDEDIRFLERENTRLSEKDELSIVPSIAGG